MYKNKTTNSNKLLEYFKGNELAANVWKSKYALENEETPDDMHKRMAKEFARIEFKYIIDERKFLNIDQIQKLSSYGEDTLLLNEEDIPNEDLLKYLESKIYNLFKDFKYIIPQGSVMSNLGNPSITSLSNCFVIGQPEDSYGGIFQKDEELVQLMKRRGGVGIDISTLRPNGTSVTNSAKTSTGAVSFMHRFSNSTREVAQGGRRGALMLSIDINHPDVMEFIKIKRDLTQVTGANISIKLNDEFMKAVEADGDYYLRFPCTMEEPLFTVATIEGIGRVEQQFTPGFFGDWDVLPYNENVNFGEGRIVRRIKAKEYWDELIKSAHNVAEPGLMFWDRMVNYSPDGVYPQFKQVTTNPCSEIGMQPYDACRLIAVNLISFVKDPFTENSIFDFEKFYEINYEAMRLSDDLVDLELEHIDRILEKINSDDQSEEVKSREISLWQKIQKTAKSSRRTGLGVTALGDCLAALNLKYDSDEALIMIDKIFHRKMESELDCTIDLSILRGSFEGWNYNNEYSVDNQFDEFDLEYSNVKGKNKFYSFIAQNFPKQIDRMLKYGRRNVSFSTCAPTGTVSLLANNCTGGIEPLFSPYYFRRKKVNSNDKDVRIDFTDQNGDTWQEFAVLHPYFKEWYNQNVEIQKKRIEKEEPDRDIEWIPIENLTREQLKISFEKSPWFGSTANHIDWTKRVEIQGIIQKYITHSISSTINLPGNVTEQEVSKIYMESWKKGLKGITVYRDGSRSGVLVTELNDKNNFESKDAVKRPKSLKCNIHTTISKGIKWNVIVGMLNDKPYEVFTMPYFTDENSLELVKIKQGRYDLLKNKETYSENITSEMNSEEEIITRLISTSLRHGADIKFIVEQLNKSNGDITSFSKAIARVLKTYIPEGTKSTLKCEDCNSSNLVFKEGCLNCNDCGSSKCG